MKKAMEKIIETNSNKDTAMWHSFEETFGRVSKTKKFQTAYTEEIIRLKLAKQVRELRLSKNLTQKNVAEKAGMPQSAVARLESGEHSISVDTLGKVAYALGKHIALT
ncbi:helix-turn-helix transcriptional regulator [Candidatus Kaiserbacteria bacterium]|nr:helix-turn-helix transcriptional regulator [Candidatus Kaiserbacteria bacterium]